MAYKQAFFIVIAAVVLIYFFVLAPGQPSRAETDNIFTEEFQPTELPGEVGLEPLQAVEPVKPSRPSQRARKSPPRMLKKPSPEPEYEYEEGPEMEEPQPNEAELLPVAEPEPSTPPPPANNTTSPPLVKNTPSVSDAQLAAELHGTPPPAVHQLPAPRAPVPRAPELRTPVPRAHVPQLDLEGYAAAASPNIDYEFELDATPTNKLPELEKELSKDSQAASKPREAAPTGAARWVQTLQQKPGNTPPKYDAYSRSKSLQGQGELKYFVSHYGHVEQMQLIKSSGHLELDTLAMDAIKKYKFVPGQEGWTRHPFKFELQ